MARSGSGEGDALLSRLGLPPAGDDAVAEAERLVADAAGRMGRSLDTSGLGALMAGAADSPRWQATGERCLSCGSCTMVCPTCFCSTVTDGSSLTGSEAARTRRWDSCFTGDFSYIHGGPVRQSAASRYRHWITHKLSAWEPQFGSLGCVGCGRCIVWCPAGIDLTEEAAAIRAESIHHGSPLS